jgi:hypothetical protein
MQINVDTGDLKDLENIFNDLNKMDQKKIIISSYRKAVKPLLSATRANLSGHNKSWGIYRSIGTIEQPNNLAIWVGSKTNTRTVKREHGRSWITKVWYAHLLELGTKPRNWRGPIVGSRITRRGKRIPIREGKGKFVGEVKGIHFFENAYNQTEDQIFSSVANDWYESIARFINRKTNK